MGRWWAMPAGRIRDWLVAQVSKPAVSPISKSADHPIGRAPGRFGNLRYSRLGGLRYTGRLPTTRECAHASILPWNGLDVIHNVIGFRNPSVDLRGDVLLTLIARDGVSVRLDASTNLVDWATIGSVQTAQGAAQFSDPDGSKFKQRFYRAVLP